MQTNTPADLERPMLRMGSIAFFAGLAIALVSTLAFILPAPDMDMTLMKNLTND
jgi:hypothetical protein